MINSAGATLNRWGLHPARVAVSGAVADLRRVLSGGYRDPKLSGLRHGIDPAVWNPATDGHLPARFDPFDLDGKDKCKAELQHDLTLPVRSDVPLFAAIGRGYPERIFLDPSPAGACRSAYVLGEVG